MGYNSEIIISFNLCYIQKNNNLTFFKKFVNFIKLC